MASAANPAAVSPNIRCATAMIQSVNPSAASSSSRYHTSHCISGHTTATSRIPPAMTSEGEQGDRGPEEAGHRHVYGQPDDQGGRAEGAVKRRRPVERVRDQVHRLPEP